MPVRLMLGFTVKTNPGSASSGWLSPASECSGGFPPDAQGGWCSGQVNPMLKKWVKSDYGLVWSGQWLRLLAYTPVSRCLVKYREVHVFTLKGMDFSAFTAWNLDD